MIAEPREGANIHHPGPKVEIMSVIALNIYVQSYLANAVTSGAPSPMQSKIIMTNDSKINQLINA